ncbi:hypothetical protein LCGC14_0566740 [marine sediment metagenome]|uniref:Uncharacterized protein n=1 Tax=marine sediment metagenome TaxID=412755 RepID=A0A0F9S3X1_9ZZZZ
MNMFEKDGRIHLQLMHMDSGRMLMDFSIAKEMFNELRDHIIEHLLAFKMEELK